MFDGMNILVALSQAASTNSKGLIPPFNIAFPDCEFDRGTVGKAINAWEEASISMVEKFQKFGETELGRWSLF